MSLTHYCPTAAELLFREESDFRLVDNPRSFPQGWPYEGLDARNAYSPFLRPGVLLGFDGLRALEEVGVGIFARPDVFAAVSRFRHLIEDIRGWTPADGYLPSRIHRASASDGKPFKATDPRGILTRSLTEGAAVNQILPEWDGRVGPVDGRVDLALRRYLAARLVGSWITFMADDLRTSAEYLELCMNTVLLFQGGRDRSEPELARWKEAFRSADLWLMHHCDPELITKNCGSVRA